VGSGVDSLLPSYQREPPGCVAGGSTTQKPGCLYAQSAWFECQCGRWMLIVELMLPASGGASTPCWRRSCLTVGSASALTTGRSNGSTSPEPVCDVRCVNVTTNGSPPAVMKYCPITPLG